MLWFTSSWKFGFQLAVQVFQPVNMLEQHTYSISSDLNLGDIISQKFHKILKVHIINDLPDDEILVQILPNKVVKLWEIIL